MTLAIRFTQLQDRPARLGYDGRDYEIARRDRIARVAPIAWLIAHESKEGRLLELLERKMRSLSINL